jgi:hypothetical protein
LRQRRIRFSNRINAKVRDKIDGVHNQSILY